MGKKYLSKHKTALILHLNANIAWIICKAIQLKHICTQYQFIYEQHKAKVWLVNIN